ncbi:MAG: formyltransferase family protein, partial [Candidatus Latescibacterota bacterium]
MSEPRIVYLSNHFSGAVKLGYLADRGVRPTALIALSPEDADRYRVAGYHDFREDAARLGIPLHQARSFTLEHPDDDAFVRSQAGDLLLISGWQRLIPASILELFSRGAVAEHGSAEYLPRGRGRSPVAWTLIAGRPRFVVHLFLADAGADSGRIIDFDAVDLNPFDDIFTVYAKVGLL